MKRLVSTLAAFLLCNSTAFAGDWVVGATLGQAMGDTSASELNDQLDALSLDATATSDDHRTAWQLYVGYEYSPRWGVELGYVDLGEVDTDITGLAADINTFLNNVSDIHPQSATGWRLSGVYRHALGPKNAVALRAGIYNWSSDYDLEAAGAKASVSDSGVSGTFGLGLESQLDGDLSLGLDFSRYSIDGEPVSVISVGLAYRLE